MLSFTVSDVDDDILTVTINYNKQFNLVEVGASNYSVTLKSTLDRETQSRYDLQITISDGTVTEVYVFAVESKEMSIFVTAFRRFFGEGHGFVGLNSINKKIILFSYML